MEQIFNESRQIYISKINKVQDFIEKHLDENIRIEQLAEIAAFSEFHFQRIFREIIGESLYSYIKRTRLEKAVFLLQSNPKLTIQEIAIMVGFSNQASFAKAIKERYKITASKIRKLGDEEMEILKSENSRNGKVSMGEIDYNNPIETNVRTIEAVKVLYVRYTGPYKGNSDLFMKLFNKLHDYALGMNLITAETKWFVTYHDFGDLTSEEKLRLSVCMSIETEIKKTNEFGCMEIAGGRYGVGRFLLDSKSYQGAWNYMISKWLPESGYIPDDRVCFEFYPSQVSTANGEEQVEIFIPITPL